jgi:Pyridoxal-phosphate dependent enzyme
MKDSVLEAVGNTPVVLLRRVVTEEMADVIVKLEYYNPTGSYKDRMALAMIEGAEARGDLRPGMRVVEYTGGSTGSSLALVCAIKGYPFVPVSSDGFAREKLQTMRLFGADLQIIPSENGKLTPELFQAIHREGGTSSSGRDCGRFSPAASEGGPIRRGSHGRRAEGPCDGAPSGERRRYLRGNFHRAERRRGPAIGARVGAG